MYLKIDITVTCPIIIAGVENRNSENWIHWLNMGVEKTTEPVIEQDKLTRHSKTMLKKLITNSCRASSEHIDYYISDTVRNIILSPEYQFIFFLLLFYSSLYH